MVQLRISILFEVLELETASYVGGIKAALFSMTQEMSPVDNHQPCSLYGLPCLCS